MVVGHSPQEQSLKGPVPPRARHSSLSEAAHSMGMDIKPDQVLEALRTVIDPDEGKDIVRLDMVRDLSVASGKISFVLLLRRPGRGFAQQAAALAAEAVRRHLGDDVEVRATTDSEMISLGDDIEISGSGPAGSKTDVPAGIRNFIAVASGKGGVGKSTVAVNLAVALARDGFEVGLLDADIYGPSVPTMFGVQDLRPRVDERQRIVPIERYGVKLLSMGFLVDPAQAVVWRGPMVSRAIRQFLGDADWGTLDYLILDLPPGTGDIQLTVVQTIALTGAMIVSTPQLVALADARKGVSMFQDVNVPVFGIVENMAYFSPPDLPDRKYFLFGEGGARRLATELGIELLGEIPLEQAVRQGGDEGAPIVVTDPDSLSARCFGQMAANVQKQVALRNATKPATEIVEILHR